MAQRVRLHPYKAGSASGKALAEALGVQRIATTSRYQARAGDLCINWGSSALRHRGHPGQIILNQPQSVHCAANKLHAILLMDTADVSIPPYTRNKQVALAAMSDPEVHWYCRTRLTGHSGEGIVVATTPNEVVDAGLYTEAIRGNRREYRVHVFNGEVIHTQQKRRRNGWQENENYSNEVRNLNGGWVFTTENVNVGADVHHQAITAVRALGLDFGAVDVLVRSSDQAVFVLEVNTSPGLEGATIEKYQEAIQGWIAEHS